MNFFDHHIGDYDKNTAHLTACEDGIYHRMIRRYLDKEKPLDADVSRIERVVRARSKEEKQAVHDVLDEFFTLEADGWHNKTCDEKITAYQEGEPEREVKKANEDNRMKRHREERARLFKVVTDAGLHAPWNVGMNELRDLAKRISETPPATAEAPSPVTPPATAPATPATATHYPLPTTHLPLPTTQGVKDSVPDGTGGKPPAPPPVLPPSPPPDVAAPKLKTPAELEKSRLWAWVKTRMVEQGSSADIKAAGILAGKLASKYGNDVFITALREGERTEPGNAHTYVVELCERAAGKRVALAKPGQMSDAEREAANAAETKKAMDLYQARYGAGDADVIDAESRVVTTLAIEA